MGIQYASQVQVETAAQAVEKLSTQLQQLTQGSQRASRVSAARVIELDALVTAANVAIDAIIAAVVDVTPTAPVWVDVTGAVVSTQYISNTYVVAGVTDNVDVTFAVTNGHYSVNSGPFTSVSGPVRAGDKIRLRGTSSASAATAVNVVGTVGGVADTYTITTA